MGETAAPLPYTTSRVASIYDKPYRCRMAPLGFRIRELREAKGWSQARLAEEAAIRQATVSGLETGTTRRIDLDTLERLGKALGVEPASLLVSTPRRRAQ